MVKQVRIFQSFVIVNKCNRDLEEREIDDGYSSQGALPIRRKTGLLIIDKVEYTRG